MRLPLSWLAEFADLPEEGALVDRLAMDGGFEDVRVEAIGPDLSALTIGHVLAREQHPNADRLSVCTVDVGDGTPRTIVCGAPNVAAGQKVVVALPGTELPGGMKIKKSKLRGVESQGMICSRRELGLGDEAEGIWVLDPGVRVGASLPDAVPVGERVLELGITPNRGDTASLLGVAREVRALFGGALRVPPTDTAESGAPARDSIRISIEARDACFAYVGRIVRGVRVGPSPAPLRARLEAAGFRSINNVVDATNAVMLELGQPLHAFDLAKIAGAEIRVRRAAPGEKIATLDGQTRKLDPADLVIADASRAVAIAGVMGGAQSEVSDATTDLLIESAHFHPTAIRLAARRHGLHSEASYRFERGVDRAGIARAADRAARLIAELAGGAVAPGAVIAHGDPAPRRRASRCASSAPIACSGSRSRPWTSWATSRASASTRSSRAWACSSAKCPRTATTWSCTRTSARKSRGWSATTRSRPRCRSRRSLPRRSPSATGSPIARASCSPRRDWWRWRASRSSPRPSWPRCACRRTTRAAWRCACATRSRTRSGSCARRSCPRSCGSPARISRARCRG
jgi:phenylalanyl-tRNA synthetase beta chain